MFDRTEAVSFIAGAIDPRAHKGLDLKALTAAALSADLAYMAREDVMDADGVAGDGYYDDDEAFEQILDDLTASCGADEVMSGKLADFLNDYMEARDLYMEQAGLVSYE